MVARLAIGLVVAGALFFGSTAGAQAHTTGAFHFHYYGSFSGVVACLYAPSGAFMGCS